MAMSSLAPLHDPMQPATIRIPALIAFVDLLLFAL